MTKEEKHLWYDYLKPYRQTYGVAFTRQKIIDNYIVDFNCPKAKLVIELDGSQHYEEVGKESDMIRDERLSELGFMVLRFSNREIDREFAAVCEKIDRTVKARI